MIQKKEVLDYILRRYWTVHPNRHDIGDTECMQHM